MIKRNGQAIVEYLILLGAVTAVVLLSFNSLLPKAQVATEGFYNATANRVYGPPPIASTGFNRYP